MSAAQRFKFDVNFDGAPPMEQDAPPAAVEREAPAEATFTQAELQAAEQSAHAAGHEKGVEEGRAAATAELQGSIEMTLAATLDTISGHLADIAGAQADLRQRFEQDAIQVACAIARKTTPRMLQDAATDMIDAVVQEVLPRLLDEPRIAVRVADGVLDSLTERLNERKTQSGFEGEFIIVSDPELEAANCRIEWADGGADVSYDRVWAEIDAVVEEFLGAGSSVPTNTAASQDSPDEPAVEPDGPAMPVEDMNREA